MDVHNASCPFFFFFEHIIIRNGIDFVKRLKCVITIGLQDIYLIQASGRRSWFNYKRAPGPCPYLAVSRCKACTVTVEHLASPYIETTHIVMTSSNQWSFYDDHILIECVLFQKLTNLDRSERNATRSFSPIDLDLSDFEKQRTNSNCRAFSLTYIETTHIVMTSSHKVMTSSNQRSFYDVLKSKFSSQ